MKSIILVYFSREQIARVTDHFSRIGVTDVLWFTDSDLHDLVQLSQKIRLHVISIHLARESNYPETWGQIPTDNATIELLRPTHWQYFALSKRINNSFQSRSDIISHSELQQATESHYLDQWRHIALAEIEKKWHYDTATFNWLFKTLNVVSVFQRYPPHWNYSILANVFAQIYKSSQSRFLANSAIPGFFTSIRDWSDFEKVDYPSQSSVSLGVDAEKEIQRIYDFEYTPPSYELENFRKVKIQSSVQFKAKYFVERLNKNRLRIFQKAIKPEYLFFLYARNKRAKQLQKSYENVSLSIEDIPFSKFVFVALHFQPEETSLRAVEYECQFGMILRLSKLIPSDWGIVIKEHPQQFGKKTNGRSLNDYDWILSTSNSCLVDVATPSTDLLRKAEATVTICGTIIYESLANNVPVISFGPGSHSLLPGVLSYQQIESLPHAEIQELLTHEKIELARTGKENMRYHFHWIEQNGIKNNEETLEKLIIHGFTSGRKNVN